MVLSPIQESPTLKFRFQSVEPAIREKRKGSKGKSHQEDSNLAGNPCVKTRGPLLWYQEDEIDIAKDKFWSEKQRVYNDEADRNALIGEKKGSFKVLTMLESMYILGGLINRNSFIQSRRS